MVPSRVHPRSRSVPRWLEAIWPAAVVLLAVNAGWRLPGPGEQDSSRGGEGLPCATVTDTPLAGPDARLAADVAEALHAAPWFYDGHVTVSAHHGVVILRGQVFYDSDLRNAQDIARWVPGVSTVLNQLEQFPALPQ